jgi:hypothetical protein
LLEIENENGSDTNLVNHVAENFFLHKFSALPYRNNILGVNNPKSNTKLLSNLSFPKIKRSFFQIRRYS